MPYQLWLPRAFTPGQGDPRVGEALTVVGRLKPGVTVEQANAELATISARAHPEYRGLGVSIGVEPFLGTRISRELWLLLGAVLFVLLIACANVTSMLLARATARERELAVRVAMGASRGDIARQLVAESLLLAGLGGLLGVALACGLLKVVVTLLPTSMRGAEADIRLSLPVLLVTAGACATAGILAGCAPAWQAARSSLNAVLGQAGAAVTSSGHLRRAFVVVEFALAVTLLTGGFLAVRSLLVLTRADLGFRPERVLTFHLPLQEGRTKSPEETWAFYRDLLERLRALPGVRTAAASTAQPFRIFYGILVQVVGRPVDPARPSWAVYNLVTPDYFRTVGLRIVKGRPFDERDTRGSELVAMVSETFVKRYLQGADPLRERLVVSDFAHPATNDRVECRIVGVYADARSRGTDDPYEEIALPFWQMPWADARVAVRTVADPFAVRRDVEAIVQSLDPVLPVAEMKTLEQALSQSLDGDRFKTLLFGSFGFVALLLAAIGVYGVTSFAVARRTREIGLRMALGAERRQVLRDVLRQGLADVLQGIALGAAGAWYATRALRGIVYTVEGGAWPFVVVVLTLLGAAVIACMAPALRAASVDPIQALRQE
jgi:putative ABC transport system permease protein